MKRILIFSGTTEGRQLADILDASGICADVCVATEYGHEVMTEGQYRNIYTGRLTEEEMKEFMQKGDYAAIVDATHPYAVVVSSNIRQASAQAGLPYYRLRRTLQSAGDDSDVIYVKSQQECVRALEQTSGNILLTTGSKELHCYCENEALRERLFVRVLPGTESIEICHKNGRDERKSVCYYIRCFGRPRNREAADRMWIKRDDCDGRICAVLSGGTDKNIVPGRMYAAYRRGTLYLSDPESGDFGRKKEF